MEIVRKANAPSPHISMLALSVSLSGAVAVRPCPKLCASQAHAHLPTRRPPPRTPPLAAGHAGEELRLRVPPADRDQGVPQQPRPPLPGAPAALPDAVPDQDPRADPRVEAHHLRHQQAQGGPRPHPRHAPLAQLQRCVARSPFAYESSSRWAGSRWVLTPAKSLRFHRVSFPEHRLARTVRDEP